MSSIFSNTYEYVQHGSLMIKSVIETCNDNSHRGLDKKTPNAVFNNQDSQRARHLSDTVHNHNIY